MGTLMTPALTELMEKLAMKRYGQGPFDDHERDRLCYAEGFRAAIEHVSKDCEFDEKPRHWYIQKPTAHNCPYKTNGAVFQEFQPTIVDNQGGEWIKVWSSADLSKYLGMGVTRWVEVVRENAGLQAKLAQALQEIERLKK